MGGKKKPVEAAAKCDNVEKAVKATPKQTEAEKADGRWKDSITSRPWADKSSEAKKLYDDQCVHVESDGKKGDVTCRRRCRLA